MANSKTYDIQDLFVQNMHFLKKQMFGTDESMSSKLGIRKSTLNDKLNRKTAFDLSEIELIGQNLGIHPGLLLYYDLSEHFNELRGIQSLMDLLTIPVIHLQIMSKFEEVKRLFKEDIINYQSNKEHEKEINLKTVG